MPSANADLEIRRLNTLIARVEQQRNEALTARAHAETSVALLMETLSKAQADLAAALKRVAELEAAEKAALPAAPPSADHKEDCPRVLS